MHPALRTTALMTVFGFVPAVAQPVTSQMLLDGLKDPGKWLMFGGDYGLRATWRPAAVALTSRPSTRPIFFALPRLAVDTLHNIK